MTPVIILQLSEPDLRVSPWYRGLGERWEDCSARFQLLREPVRQTGKQQKPQKLREKPKATGNRRLAQQIRKILGKHYASKYRVR